MQVDKKRVEKLYGSPEINRLMQMGPNQFVTMMLADIDLTGLNILELFCGTGYICNMLAEKGAECTGIDISPEAIAAAKRNSHPNCMFIVEDVEHFVPIHTFDIVIMPFGLQYVEDPEATIREALKMTASLGGKLIVADAYKVGSFAAMTGIPSQVFSLIKLGRSHGMSVREIISLILRSSQSFGLFNLPEWLELEEIRKPLDRNLFINLAKHLGGKYIQLGNAYFILEFNK